MSWNYRIVKEEIKQNDKIYILYSLREVHYNRNGDAWAMSSNPISFSGHENLSDLIWSIETALSDIKKHPTFEVPEKWAPDDIELDGTIKVKDKDNNIIELYCPKCGGIIVKLYEWKPDMNLSSDGFLSCYKCNARVDLTELDLKEIEESNGL